MSSQYLAYIVCSVLSFVPAIVFHEVAHGFAAYKLGDPTAKRAGRLSLNPLKHVDPFGTVILPLCMLAIVGLAGPAANLVMAALAGAIAWALYGQAPALVAQSEAFAYFYLMFLPMFALINLYLLFFNLLPIPPLDGSSVLALFIPKKHMSTYYRVQHYAMPVFMIVLIVLPYVLHVNPVGVYLDVTAGNVANLLFPFRVS